MYENENQHIFKRFIFACRSTAYAHNIDKNYLYILFLKFINDEKIYCDYFTNSCNSRNLILDVDYYKFINILLYGCYKLRSFDKYSNIFNNIDFNSSDIYSYLNDHKSFLEELSYYFIDDFIYGDLYDSLEVDEDKFWYFLFITYNNKMIDSSSNHYVYNKCRDDVKNGKQSTYQEVSYFVGSMNATMNIGKNRSKQEDSALIVSHPENSDFKFMMVADGMGGFTDGEFASNYIAKSMLIWFEGLNSTVFEDINLMKLYFYMAVLHCNELLVIENIYRDILSGTTFVGALVGRDYTVIINIGDSRAYFYGDKKLIRATRDDSYVQDLCDHKIIKDGDMRFHVLSNQITQFLGDEVSIKPGICAFPNKCYDSLVLVTDGVTDCINEEILKKLVSHKNPNHLSEFVVKTALNNDSYLRKDLMFNPKYYDMISGGKDNTTAVVYNNKVKVK